MVDAQLDILVCPHCRQARLTVIDAQTGVVCPQCRLVYPVRDDIPILSEEAAVPAEAWFMGSRGPWDTESVFLRTEHPSAEVR